MNQNKSQALALIKAHQEYVRNLQNEYAPRCDIIKQETQEKISSTDKNDKAVIQKILDEEGRLLDQTVVEFQNKVNDSARKVREQLEEDDTEHEKMDLEAELNKI